MNILHKLAATTLLLLMPLSSRAQIPSEVLVNDNVPGFSVHLAAGLGRDSSFDLPYPLAVRVKNSSGSDFDGNLIIAFFSNKRVPAVRIPVEIPDNSHKVYRLCLPIEHYMSLDVSFVDSGKRFWSARVPLAARDKSDSNGFNLLTIDSKARKLTVVRSAAGASALDQYNTLYDRATINPNCETVPAWSIPEHDAPLYSFDGILFSNDSQADSLAAPQLQALGKYLVGGGSLAVPQERSNLRERIMANLPFNVEWSPTVVTKALHKQSVGKGLLITYDGTLYPITDGTGNILNNPLQLSVMEHISGMPQTNFPGTMAVNYNTHHSDISTRGATSILVVIGMFLLYTIVIGPFTFFFRKNKRNMAIFLGLSVSSFIGISIVCGVFLRNRKGDMDWMTVTEITPDGSIQTAGITVRSCAGQKHDLTLLPDRTEMRMFRADSNHNYRRYSYQFDNFENQRANTAFATLPTDSKESNELEVPLAPWGRGHVLARSYIPKLKPLEIKLDIVKADARSDKSTSRSGGRSPRITGKKAGNLNAVALVSLVNTLNVPLQDIEVVFQVYTAHVNQYGNSGNAHINTVAFIARSIGPLRPGEERTFKHRLIHPQQFNYYNRSNRVRYDYQKDKGTVALLLPKLNHRQKMHVVVIGRVEESLSMKLGDSDFVVGNGSHFIIQSLPSDAMPNMTDYIIDAAKINIPQPKTPIKGAIW